MAWLDAVLATPVAGLRLAPNYRSALDAAGTIAPLIDELERRTKGKGMMLQAENPWDLSIVSPEGLTYKFATDNLTIDFKYPRKLERQPAMLPAISAVELRPYTQLANFVLQELDKAARLLAKSGALTNRFGLVAVANLDPAAPPPGVAKLLDRFKQVWSRPLLETANTKVLVQVQATDTYEDRCHYLLIVKQSDDSEKGHLDLQLDFQRVLKQAMPIAEAAARLPEWARIAQDYFERVGAGEVNE